MSAVPGPIYSDAGLPEDSSTFKIPFQGQEKIHAFQQHHIHVRQSAEARQLLDN
jgi:hypothetical protein